MFSLMTQYTFFLLYFFLILKVLSVISNDNLATTMHMLIYHKFLFTVEQNDKINLKPDKMH